VDPSRSDASLYLRCLGDVVLGNHREDSDGGRDTPWYTQSVSPIDSGFQKLQTKSLQTLSVDACNEIQIQIQIKVARIVKFFHEFSRIFAPRQKAPKGSRVLVAFHQLNAEGRRVHLPLSLSTRIKYDVPSVIPSNAFATCPDDSEGSEGVAA
jgi:hypothetical protein